MATDKNSRAFRAGRDGHSAPASRQGEDWLQARQNYQAGQAERAATQRNAQSHASSGPSFSGASYSGGAPLAALLLLPFRLIAWTFRALLWMARTNLGRITFLILAAAVAAMWFNLTDRGRSAESRMEAINALSDADFTQRAIVSVRHSPGNAVAPREGAMIESSCVIELAPFGDDYFTRFTSECAGLSQDSQLERARTFRRNDEQGDYWPGYNYLLRRSVDGAPAMRWQRLIFGPNTWDYPPGAVLDSENLTPVVFTTVEDDRFAAERGRVAETAPAYSEAWEIRFVSAGEVTTDSDQ